MQQKWTNKLNNDEFNLIENDWYPLIKKNAMEKLKAQLHEFGQEVQSLNPQESFKISAGARLQDLHDLVLDFPKIPNPQFTFVQALHGVNPLFALQFMIASPWLESLLPAMQLAE